MTPTRPFNYHSGRADRPAHAILEPGPPAVLRASLTEYVHGLLAEAERLMPHLVNEGRWPLACALSSAVLPLRVLRETLAADSIRQVLP